MDDYGSIGREFLSTLPAWGATFLFSYTPTKQVFLSTLPAWGATAAMGLPTWNIPISIHAPRVGSDFAPAAEGLFTVGFLSTLPAWGATLAIVDAMQSYTISIHAPRVGSDADGDHRDAAGILISIHAPRVGSDATPPRALRIEEPFLSTLPAWGATSPGA